MPQRNDGAQNNAILVDVDIMRRQGDGEEKEGCKESGHQQRACRLLECASTESHCPDHPMTVCDFDDGVLAWLGVLMHTGSGGLAFWQILAMVMVTIIISLLYQICRASHFFVPRIDPRIDSRIDRTLFVPIFDLTFDPACFDPINLTP